MIMDSNYSWNQPEHNGPAQKIWSKAYLDVFTNKIIKQSSINLHNYPYFQNELPIHSTFSPNVKEAWHNPPFRLEEYSILSNDDDENKKSNKKEKLLHEVLEFIKRKREYNKASTFGIDIQFQFGMISTVNIDLHPWNTKNKRYQKNLNGLHEEILDFYQYIMPTVEEQEMRQEVVARLKKVVLKEWPEAIVDVFGSFKTELHLPTSDIDVVIFGNWESPLWTLNDIIQKSGIASDSKVLDRATVPIVKMTDKETEVRIDISFNMKNGIQSANLIKSFIKEYPQLPQLVLLLKQYLLQRDLNEVWTGGISSYSLILMCVSFMKLRAKKLNAQENLGETLIMFLELYGRNFDYLNMGIRTEGDTCHVPKEEILKNMEGNHWSSILCIEDPLNPVNDIGRSSYGALHIKMAFDYAYNVLSRVILPQSAHLFEDGTSILGRIIRITPEVMKYRNLIKEKFSKKKISEEMQNQSIKTTTTSSSSSENTVINNEIKKNPNSNNSNQKMPCNINEQGDVPSKHEISYSLSVQKKSKPYTKKQFVVVNNNGNHDGNAKPNHSSKLSAVKNVNNNAINNNNIIISHNNHHHHHHNHHNTSSPLKKFDSDYTNKHTKKTKATVNNGVN